MSRRTTGDQGGTGPVYRNPFRDASVTAGRVDMGTDYTGSGPIKAIGPGVIEQTRNAGWQPGGTFILERITEGPLAGRRVYFAEDIQPAVQVGDHVDSSTTIGYFAPAGGVVEAGWAGAGGQPLAALAGQQCQGPGQDPGCHPTQFGADFNNLMAGLGAPKAKLSQRPVGSLPPGWLPRIKAALGDAGAMISSLPGKTCLIPLPSFQAGQIAGFHVGPTIGGGCAVSKTEARAVMAVLIIAAGGLVLLAGAIVLAAWAGERSQGIRDAAGQVGGAARFFFK